MKMFRIPLSVQLLDFTKMSAYSPIGYRESPRFGVALSFIKMHS